MRPVLDLKVENVGDGRVDRRKLHGCLQSILYCQDTRTVRTMQDPKKKVLTAVSAVSTLFLATLSTLQGLLLIHSEVRHAVKPHLRQVSGVPQRIVTSPSPGD